MSEVTKKIQEHETETIDPGIIGEESLPISSMWKDILRRFRHNRLAVIGVFIMTITIFMCISAPLFTKFDPVLDMQLMNRLLPVGSPEHILGTDDLGRDIFSRILYGGRVSLLTGLIVSIFTMIIGVFIGCISGYFGGWLDNFFMRIVDIFLAFPFLVLAIAIMAALGPSQKNIILTLVIVGWPSFARLTRGQILSLKEKEYIEASKASGFSHARIMFFHILPNALAPIIVMATLRIGGTIMSAASLNFLGLGVDSSLPEWGVMLNQARDYMTSAPHLSIFPGVAISLSVLSMNWIGDGLRDALDPRMRK